MTPVSISVATGSDFGVFVDVFEGAIVLTPLL